MSSLHTYLVHLFFLLDSNSMAVIQLPYELRVLQIPIPVPNVLLLSTEFGGKLQVENLCPQTLTRLLPGSQQDPSQRHRNTRPQHVQTTSW